MDIVEIVIPANVEGGVAVGVAQEGGLMVNLAPEGEGFGEIALEFPAEVGDRPDRVEPRATKRRPKKQTLLTVPRQIAR